MIRVVLAVLLATAIAGIVLPAAEAGGTHHANTRLRAELSSLATAMERFAAHNDAVPPDREGATRVVTVRAPSSRLGVDPAVVTLGDSESAAHAASDTLGWRLGTSGPFRSVRVGVPLAVVRDGRPVTNGSLRLRGGGAHRLRFRLVRVDGRAVVLVRRFMKGDGATPTHVRRNRRRLSL